MICWFELGRPAGCRSNAHTLPDEYIKELESAAAEIEVSLENLTKKILGLVMAKKKGKGCK